MSLNDPHPEENRFLDLLHGLLPADDAEALLSHISSCESCELSFRARVAVHERLRGRLSEILPEPPPRDAWWRLLPQLSIPRRGVVFGTAAGAIATVLLLAFAVRQPGHDTRIPDTDFFWLPDPGKAVLARDPTALPSDENLRMGLEAYRRHDLARAAALLSEASAPGSLANLRGVYLGSALAGTGRFAEAAAVLKQVSSESLPDPWRDESRWTLCVALLKSGRGAEGDSLLKILAAEGTPVGERARAHPPALR